MKRALVDSVDQSLDRLGVNSGEEVALLTDTATEPVVWETFFDRISARGSSPTVVIMPPRSANGLEPTGSAASALLDASVVLALTSASATHTKALKTAAERGALVCSLPGITVDMLEAAVMRPDYDEMQALADRLMEIFAAGREMRIVTDAGTDLRIGMGGWARMPMADDGVIGRGSIGNLPAGEVLIVPWEGDSDGTLVVDLAVSPHPEPLTAPVTITFADGRAVAVEGGEPGRRVAQLFEENGEASRNNAEVALGINPHARNTGVLLETEKQFGTAHLGIGNSSNLGGRVWAPIHVDVIFDRPTVSVDGRVVLRDRVYNPDVLRKESFRDVAPLARPRLRDADTVLNDGRLAVRWADVQHRERISQVGDDETATRAGAVLAQLRDGAELDADARRVAAVMALYGAAEEG